jgi:hypothetical protein
VDNLIHLSVTSTHDHTCITFLHMRTTTNETACVRFRRHATGVLQCLGPAKPTSTRGRVLIRQMGVLGATALSKVFDLHDLGEHRNIHGRFCSFREIVSLQDFRVLHTSHIHKHRVHLTGRTAPYLMEGSLVPVFLQELLLAFWLPVPSAFGIFHILFEPLFLG